MFSCKFCKSFKNTFFVGHLRTTASDNTYIKCFERDFHRKIQVNADGKTEKSESAYNPLTLIWVRFEVRGGVKLPPPNLKPVRITLETWNLVRKYKYIFSFRKYTF